MIDSTRFDRLRYRKPKLKDDRPKIDKIIGIDSEAYTNGTPFMLCTSLGETLLLEDFPGVLFEPRYVNANFMVYNIKYDSGAILRHLPEPALRRLWSRGEVSQGGYRYTYIPHKLLRIQEGNNIASFWDISQFFKMSLEKAAQTYLGKSKRDISTKKFTQKYVERFWHSIAKYCITDATLTAELGKYLVDKLEEFGIIASALYSCASISFKYFCETSNVVTSWRFWRSHKRMLAMACDSYEGGKFEVTRRGYFPLLHEYDLTSAYPYEIANLVDISGCYIEYNNRYDPDAQYGFYRVKIFNALNHLPCGMMRSNVRIYPSGEYHLTITKQEYEYLESLQVPMQMHSGVNLYVDRIRYPYRKTIDTLFKIKSDYKGKDTMLYNTTKIIMNSFYGKCVQCIEQPGGDIVAGAGWNPVYGSVITANTRIAVTRIQNQYPHECVAVHTDSVMLTRELPKHLAPGGLGKFEHVVSGPAYVIACGMYQIGGQCAFKGFIPRKGDSWQKILTRHRNRSTIPYSALRVESWIEAMAKNHGTATINVFARVPRKIDLNCDTKRIWPGRIKGRDLLSRNEDSLHKLILETDPPKHWENN